MRIISVLMLVSLMACATYLRPNLVNFTPSADSTECRIFYCDDPCVLDYTQLYIPIGQGQGTHDLNASLDTGAYNLGVACYNALGNGSDIITHHDNPKQVDKTFPENPSWL